MPGCCPARAWPRSRGSTACRPATYATIATSMCSTAHAADVARGDQTMASCPAPAPRPMKAPADEIVSVRLPRLVRRQLEKEAAAKGCRSLGAYIRDHVLQTQRRDRQTPGME